MNNGDDIHNLLKTLGHDAGLYQDLAKYNASRTAHRRAAMGRPSEVVPSPPPSPAAASAAPAAAPLAATRDDPAALSAILHRLSSPEAPRAAQVHGQPLPASAHPARESASPQPARLDRLFGRLITRTTGTPER
jgi:hypothetical protein